MLAAIAEIQEFTNELTSHPEILWDDVRGMRNIVIYEYFQVNLSIIWQTLQEDLVSLE